MMKSLLYLCVLAMPIYGWTQSRQITGKVTSAEDGSALPGVNVIIKGTTTGTVTNMDGAYVLVAPAGNQVLVFTFIGLRTEEVDIGNRTTVDIKMGSDIRQLTEVIVTGLGQQEKLSYTGSISEISSEDIVDKPVASIDQALQGSIAGLQLSSTSGTPGAVQDIRIRGRSSITAANDPLFVIDGVPVISGENNRSTSTGDLNVLATLNSNDIESISVLKDAMATALYGARGANGVIIITTKSGKSGKPVITFSAQSGVVSKAVDGPKMLNSAQRDEMYYEAVANAGYTATVEEAKEEYPNSWDGETDTNWGKVLTNDDARTQRYDVSLNGGFDRSNYYASMGYFQQDGPNLGIDYERVTGKFNIRTSIGEKASIENGITGGYNKQNGQLEGAAYFGNSELAKLFLAPWFKPYNDDGTPNISYPSSIFNPLFIMRNDVNRKEQTRVLNNTVFRLDLLNNLQFSSTLGLDYLITEELYYRNLIHGDGVDVDDYGNDGETYAYTTRNFNWAWRNMLSYDVNIGSAHKLSVRGIYEAQQNKYYTVGVGGMAIAAEGLIYPTTTATPNAASGYRSDWGINSITGLAEYSFLDKLFVTASLRGEGNSRFAPNKRWGAFYAVGTSWLLNKESFLNSVRWLDLAKLRVSYGKTGNTGVGLNKYQPLLAYDGTYSGSAAVYPSQIGNEDLTWEKSRSINIGVDIALLHKLSFTVEYFSRTSYDLLLNVPLSRTTGFSSQWRNTGEMVNKGIEGTLNLNVLNKGDFDWKVGMNFTSVDNEVTKLPRSPDGEEIGITGSTRIVTEGEAAYTWNMRTWAGVDTETGAPLWYVNGRNGETTSSYSAAEVVTQGASALPTIYGGISTNIEFKGIYLSGLLYYSTGNKTYDIWSSYTQSDGRYTYSYNAYARQYNHWRQPGDVAPNPKNIYGNSSSSNSTSSRFLYDGDYLRLRDITLGYRFPKGILSNLKMSNASIYVKGYNLWTKVYDDNLEFDPEVRADGELDLNAVPLKTLVFGINVGF